MEDTTKPAEGPQEEQKGKGKCARTKQYAGRCCRVSPTHQLVILAVHIVLYPTGGTPIIKKKNFKVDPNYTIGQIIALIRKFINLDASETLVD